MNFNDILERLDEDIILFSIGADKKVREAKYKGKVLNGSEAQSKLSELGINTTSLATDTNYMQQFNLDAKTGKYELLGSPAIAKNY